MCIRDRSFKKYGKQIPKLGNDAQAVLNDIKTDINMPFVLKWDGKEFELIAKTIMRKKDFKTSNKKLSFEENQPKRILRLAKSFKRKYD